VGRLAVLAFYLHGCHTRTHRKHTSHRDTVASRPTSRPTAAQARPGKSVTVSDGDAQGERAPSRLMGGKLVASVAIYVAPERSFGAGALDDKRVPALPVTTRCSRPAPPPASERISGRSPRSPKTCSR